VAPMREPRLVFVQADRVLHGLPGSVFEVPVGFEAHDGPPHDGARARGPGDGAAWHLYPQTALRRIAMDAPGRMDGGAVVAFSSSLPPAAGLSSSTALLTAFWMALDVRFGLASAILGDGSSHEPDAEPAQGLALARYLSALESGRMHEGPRSPEAAGGPPPLFGLQGVGTEGGSQDHAAILLARAGHLTQLRFRPLARLGEVALPSGWMLAVGVSGVQAEKAAGARGPYNRLAAEARDAAARWRERTGGQERHLGAILEVLGTPEPGLGRGGADPGTWMGARFHQFRAECQEVLPAIVEALESWEDRGPERLGRAVRRSQRMAEEILRNQVPETRSLVRSARRLGSPAASAFGAGFGGAVWAIVRREDGPRFLRGWRNDYLGRFPRRAPGSRFFTTPAGPGAFRLF
jgi:galactokinase